MHFTMKQNSSVSNGATMHRFVKIYVITHSVDTELLHASPCAIDVAMMKQRQRLSAIVRMNLYTQLAHGKLSA
jgi:hypothetical protein